MTKFLIPLILLCAVCTQGQAAPPNLILTNGKVFTAAGDNSRAEAIAIKGDRIVAVGSNLEIRKLAGKRTRILDLGGRVVVPGFNDAHAHFVPDPKARQLEFDTLEPTFEQVANAVKAAVKSAMPGEWIHGTIGGTAFLNAGLDRTLLDSIAPDHPVLLSTFYGHGSVLNSKAMTALKVTEDVADPAGGWFERDPATKRPNGRVFEYAQWRLDRERSSMASDAEIVAKLKQMGAEAAAFGITSIQIMPIIGIERFVKLLRVAKLPIRVRAIPFSVTTPTGRDLSEINLLPKLKSDDPLITVGGIKWILDGSPFERGAAVRRPYADDPKAWGRMNFDRAKVESMLREAIALDQQILLHAVGDQAAQIVFDAMESVGGGKIDWPSKRVRIEHGEGVTDDQVKRARELGVIVVQNPTHFSFVEMLHARWSPKTSMGPQKTLLAGEVHYAIGSDGPMSPGLNIMFATAYPARPAESITREQAVTAYTRGSAYAEFAENEKGSIKAGMLADLAVLSQDIFIVPGEALPGTTSLLTLVGGKIVHNARVVK